MSIFLNRPNRRKKKIDFTGKKGNFILYLIENAIKAPFKTNTSFSFTTLYFLKKNL